MNILRCVCVYYIYFFKYFRYPLSFIFHYQFSIVSYLAIIFTVQVLTICNLFDPYFIPYK